MADHIDERWVNAHSRPPNGVLRAVWALLNPRVSVYWLWLVIAFGAIAAAPCLPFEQKLTGSLVYLPVATAYSRPGLFEYWQAILLLHTFIALMVAVPAAVRHTVVRRERGQTERLDFNLRQLFTGTGIVAAVFGLLAWYGAPLVVYCVVLLLYFGWPTTLILAGIICRQRRSLQGDSNSARPPNSARLRN